MSFVVAITGGRDFKDQQLLRTVLNALHAQRTITVIRNGGMTGADALSSRWAYEKKVDTECYGADWHSFGSAAGPLRNGQMLAGTGVGGDIHADLLVAFPGGRGTDSAVKIARELNIAVLDHRGDKD